MYLNANWDKLPWVDVRPGVRRKAFSSQGATLALNELQPHHAPNPHAPPQEQLVYLSGGTSDYHVGDEVFRLAPGGMLVVPPDVEHYAEVVGDEVLVNFDVFTPRREEYMQ